MCYNTEAGCRKALEYARLRGNHEKVAWIEKKIEEFQKWKLPLYHTIGQVHPEILVFTDAEPFEPQYFTWGLIAFWNKDLASAKVYRKNALNARSETMFTKATFREPVRSKRCLMYVDGYYDYHSANKKKYPFRITMKNGDPMIIAGLWDEWVDKSTGEIYKTCAMVTCDPNPIMAKIHNEPKSSDEPRMPVILTKENQDQWLVKIDPNSEADKKMILDMCVPFDQNLLEWHTVKQLTGKNGIGNKPEAREQSMYADLDYNYFS